MYENKTAENIKAEMLAKITDIETREGSFINDMLSPVSMELESAYNQLDVLLSTMFLDDIRCEYLDKRASEYGIYRKQGTKAKGQVTFTGSENTIIPKGSLISTGSNLMFETVDEVTIPAEQTTVVADIISSDIGSKYNVSNNTIVNIPSAINGVVSVTNEKPITGGTDVELDEALLKRLLHQLRNPATSGNPAHYKIWALEVNGIGDVKVFPTHFGNGTVLVLPITSEKQAPTEDIIQKVKNHIETKRPIGATVTVNAPIMTAININATITTDGVRPLEDINHEFTKLFKKYITDSVFKIYTVDYFKCLSIFYEISGVRQVTDFKLNNDKSNITIDELAIQSVGTINITGGA